MLPELSAKISVKTVKNSAGKVIAHKLAVKVTDAGDALKGAIASTKGHHKKTNALGVAKLTFPGSTGAHVTVNITAPGYETLKQLGGDGSLLKRAGKPAVGSSDAPVASHREDCHMQRGTEAGSIPTAHRAS